MRIVSVKVKSYKGFLATHDLQLAPNMNIIVGQNHSGKSAFIEAVSTKFQQRPHVSKSVQSEEERLDRSEVVVTFSVSVSEIIDALFQIQGVPNFSLALPREWLRFYSPEDFIESINRDGATIQFRSFGDGGASQSRYPVVQPASSSVVLNDVMPQNPESRVSFEIDREQKKLKFVSMSQLSVSAGDLNFGVFLHQKHIYLRVHPRSYGFLT